MKRGESLIIIDYCDKRPIYEQITERLQNLMLSGGLEPDSQLPSVRQLAMDLALNPNTIQRAYTELERSGYIYSVKGRGNFVRDHKTLSNLKKQQLHARLRESVLACRMAGMRDDEIRSEFDKVLEEEKDD